MKVKEITHQEFGHRDRLASYNMWGNHSDAVMKKKDGYSIRLAVSIGMKSEWTYFELDTTGLIIQSPRGMAKCYNKRVRITDMDAMVSEFKGKVINQW